MKIIKLLLGLIGGFIGGLLIGAVIALIFTGLGPVEFMNKLLSIEISEGIIAALTGIAGFLISVSLLIPAHEGGHLVCGLLSGYKFVSFRIFNLTFIRINGRMRVKRFGVAGTGGQCLLTPPQLPIDEIPTAWYNAGGLLVNLLLLIAAIPLLLLLDLSAIEAELLVVFMITNLMFLLLNGIPMQGNDAYNMLQIRNGQLSKRALVIQLRSNALIQEGVRPKDMPNDWFEWRTDVNWKKALEVSIPMMHASRELDMMNMEQAYAEFSELYKHKDDIMELYVMEIACELAFCAMVTGREQEARELLSSKIREYAETYSRVMSSKQRLLFATALCLDNDRAKAETIYTDLEKSRDRYLLQGEVKSDLAIMRAVLSDGSASPQQ